MKKEIQIGFIQAKNNIDVNWFRPLAFGYLKAYLEKYSNVPFEMNFFEDLEDIKDLDILAISSSSQDFDAAKEIAFSAKQQKKNIINILGGHHITNLPQTLPENVDIGVIGEGEETFLELIKFLYNNSLKITPESLKWINGIVFRCNESLEVTSRRELIKPLDRIPIPYRSSGEKVYLFSSRGCPFKCAFCSSSAFWKKTRFFSAEYVINEIEYLLSKVTNLNHISICDDLFIAHPKRLKQIADLINKREINKRVSFDLAVRANLVNEELCEILKKMNTTAVSFGVESGSDRILDILNKNLTVVTNQRALDILHQHGFLTGGSFIVGVPTETEEDVHSTYTFLLDNIKSGKISSHSAVNILMPMPGTKIWLDAIRRGIIDLNNINWKRLAVFSSYRNSNISNFDLWLQQRRKNNSIYMAENTLPQEKLYEIMSYYEQKINEIEKNQIETNHALDLYNKKLLGTSMFKNFLRKIVKALYFFFTDWSEFKKRVKNFYYLTRNKVKHSDLIKPDVNNLKSTKEQLLLFPESALAHKYCIGKGLEIGGSAHNPFGLNTLNVDFTDSMETIFKKEEIKCCGKAMKVDIVAYGDDIPLPDGSQDFIVSSHVMEHFPNPIKALLEWDRLIKPGGVIFMIVPHKERTFDSDNECTQLEHLIEDYRNNNTKPHNNPHGHDHCWTTETFKELIDYMIYELHMKWKIAEIHNVDDKVGNGFTFVMRKIETQNSKA